MARSPPEMQERYLGIVLSETERLNKLTEGLLMLNSFDDQRIYLDLTEFDISEVIRHTLDTFEVHLARKYWRSVQTFRMSHSLSVRIWDAYSRCSTISLTMR